MTETKNKRKAQPTDARRTALAALEAVWSARGGMEEALEQALRRHPLPPQERAFAFQLAMTALRRLGAIDAIIAELTRKPPQPRLVQVLRLGIAQLLWMRVPPHAAVDQTVSLAGKSQGERNFVNAILQRVQREREDVLRRHEAALDGLPEWLRDSWRAAYGEAAEAMARQHLAPPPLDLTLKEDAGPWAERLGGAVLVPGSVRLAEAAEVTALPGFAEGAWWVQDLAAGLPVRLMGALEGQRVVDLCAAPGGKTAQLAQAGAKVWAVDQQDRRMRRLEENLHRLGFSAATAVADGRRWRPDSAADGVVLDAPCSATGTLRRHPEIAWLRRPGDLTRLAALQRELLANAAAMLRPGGWLLYITCSLQPEEGEAQAAWAGDALGLEPWPFDATLPGGLEGAVTAQGWLRTLPSMMAAQGGMDGFFAARWRKRGGGLAAGEQA